MSPKAEDGRVVAYCRVSTDEQADSGAGLAAQRAAIASECQRRGWEVVSWYEDPAVSGGVPVSDRPGGQAMLAALARKEASGLVVAKLDWLTRSVQDAARLLTLFTRKGWALVVMDLGVDTSPRWVKRWATWRPHSLS